MKALALIILIIATHTASAQDSTIEIRVRKPVMDDRVFLVVEQMPAYPGGDDALIKFIRINVRYPDLERENNIQGRVVVSFIVETDGSISNIAIRKGVSKGINKEALRVVGLMPRFRPGRQSGQSVRVQYILPIQFRLSDPDIITPPKRS